MTYGFAFKRLINAPKIYNEPDVTHEVTKSVTRAPNKCTLVKAFNEHIEWLRNFVNSWKRQILSNQFPAASKSREGSDHLPEISKGVAIIGNL